MKLEQLRKLNDLAAAMIETSGNKSKAADLACISRATAYNYMKKDSFKKIYGSLMRFASKSSLDSPEVIKGRMINISESNIGDYFDKNGSFIGFDKLSVEQQARIKKFTKVSSEKGEKLTIELHDAMKAIEILGKPHSIFESKEFDLSVFDGLSNDDLLKVAEILGWNDADIEQEITMQVKRRLSAMGRG